MVGWSVLIDAPLSRASITIRHVLLRVALPSGRSGTDRGRQTASQRIAGGLVSHHRQNALLAAHVGAADARDRSTIAISLVGAVQGD